MAEQRPPRTLGPGHDTFWDYCGKGELRLQRCDTCNGLTWPVAPKCEHCGSDALQWEKMSGRGTIVSGCTFERDYYKGILPIPWETILVELEEGPLFLSNPIGMTWREAEVGMAVKLSFVAAEDKAGAFQIPVFERA